MNGIAASLADVNDKLKRLECKLTQEQASSALLIEDDDDLESEEGLDNVPLIAIDDVEQKRNLLPDWLYDPDLKDGDTDTISATEEQFWVDLIEKYLTPLDMTAKDKQHVQDQLKVLRDISVFAFTMGNALFVLINLLLQLNKEYLQMAWPLNIKHNIIYDGNTMEINIERDYLFLEPISLLFVAFFGVVLFVQFIAMLFHRFATISQILATTTIDWYCSRKVKDTISASELRVKAVEIARFLQRPRPEWRDDDDDDDMEDGVKRKLRKDTLHRLLMQHKKLKDWSNLETNFKRELFKEGDLKLKKLRLSRRTESILDEMRKSMAEYRRLKKSSTNYVAPSYYMNSRGGYSTAQSVDSQADSFTIYQRAACEKSPTNSVYVDGTRLKSALKRSKSQVTVSLNDGVSLYASVGADNYGFEDEKAPEIVHRRKNVDDEKKEEDDTYI